MDPSNMSSLLGIWTLLLVCATLSDTAGTTQTCRDVDPHCDKYNNICAPNVRNWAQQYCAKYCGLCTVGTTASTTSTSTTSTTQRTTTRTTPSTTLRTTVAPCEDLYLGSCKLDLPNCGSAFVSSVCRKTCGVCHDALTSPKTTSPKPTTSATTPKPTTSTTTPKPTTSTTTPKPTTSTTTPKPTTSTTTLKPTTTMLTPTTTNSSMTPIKYLACNGPPEVCEDIYRIATFTYPNNYCINHY